MLLKNQNKVEASCYLDFPISAFPVLT